MWPVGRGRLAGTRGLGLGFRLLRRRYDAQGRLDLRELLGREKSRVEARANQLFIFRRVVIPRPAPRSIVKHADSNDPIAAVFARVTSDVTQDLCRPRRELAGKPLHLVIVAALAGRVRRLTFSPRASACWRDTGKPSTLGVTLFGSLPAKNAHVA